MRNRMLRIGLGLLSGIALLVAAGCGSSVNSTPAAGQAADKRPESTAQPAPKAVERVTVPMAMGSRDAFIYLQPLLAEQLGFLDAEGISVEAKTFSGGTAVAKALATGEVKFAHMALDHVVRYGANDMVALVSYNQAPGMVFMVDPKYKDQIKSFADLKGKKVGITTPGSGSHNILLKLVLNAGLNVTDVEYVPVGFDLEKAFAEGKVVAGSAYDPLATKMVQQGTGVMFADLRSTEQTKQYLGGPYPITGLVTTRQVLRDEPELVERVVRAITKANEWLYTNTAESVAKNVPAEVKGSDEQLYITAIKNSKPMFSPDGKFSPFMIDQVVGAMKAAKIIPESEKIEADKLIYNAGSR